MWINLSSILVLLFRTVIATPLVSSVNGLAGRDDSFMIGRSINTGGPSPIGNYLSNSGGPLDIEDFDPVGLVNTGPPLPNDKAIIVRLNTDAPNPVVPSSDPGAIGQVSYGDGFGQTGSVDSTQYLASTSKVVTLQLCLTKDDAKIEGSSGCPAATYHTTASAQASQIPSLKTNQISLRIDDPDHWGIFFLIGMILNVIIRLFRQLDNPDEW